ncbi:MAG: hypothetical protein JWQ12_1719 [Glaciihabitans sp.]|jgi:peptide/nickel transport system substrate-binding protein|nr:hypothetical protein [Glaciihabitans sp.]
MKGTRKSRTASRTLIVAAAISVIALLAGCSSTSSSGSASGTKQIVAGWPSDLTTFDPAYMQTDQDKELMMNVYQPLVDYALVEKNGALTTQGIKSAPKLASSWVMSGSTITFTMQKGVKFYPSGNPLTAEDAVFALERNLDPTAGGLNELNGSGVFKASQLKVISPSKFSISYTDAAGKPVQATELNLATLRIPYYSPIDSKAVLSHATKSDPMAKAWMKTNLAGTGPYYVKDRQAGQSIDLAAVPKLWSGEPTYQNVKIQVLNQANVASLVSGKSVDVALFGVTPSDASELATKGFSVFHGDTPDYMYLQLAEDKGPLADEKVRQAIANVVPYSDITSKVFFGRAQRATSFFSPKGQGYIPAWSQYGSLTKAKALMAAAGNPKISTTLQYSNDDATFESTALLLKNALAQIGITITLKPTTSAGMFSVIGARATGSKVGPNDGMVLHNLSVYIEDAKGPVNFWMSPGAALDWQRMDNKEVNALQAQYALAPLNAARQAAYEKMQNILATDASFIPIEVTGRNVVTSKSITGVSFQPEIGIRYWELTTK